MPPSSVILCMVTKNKAINTTTLHSAMNLNMLCMSNNINLEIHFVTDRSNLHKYIKSSAERLLWLDYGVSIDVETIKRLAIEDFPEGYKVLVAPCVVEGVDWELFKKKTLEGSTEPVHQRGLAFDTVTTPASKKFGDTLADFVSSSSDCRVFSMECKAILKKLRDADSQFKSFEHLKKIGVKIGVLRSCSVLCHYVYESVGNILDSSGVRTGP